MIKEHALTNGPLNLVSRVNRLNNIETGATKEVKTGVLPK
jgi:hypothetical protein